MLKKKVRWQKVFFIFLNETFFIITFLNVTIKTSYLRAARSQYVDMTYKNKSMFMRDTLLKENILNSQYIINQLHRFEKPHIYLCFWEKLKEVTTIRKYGYLYSYLPNAGMKFK